MNETMRIAIFTRPNEIEIQRRPVPALASDHVLVKVIVCGICASDLLAWKGGEHNVHNRYPYSPGHEFCGIVEKLGSDVTTAKIGQRVVINPNLGCGECDFCQNGKPNLCDFLKSRPIKSNGGFSEYVALDYRMVYTLPDSLPDALAVFVEPLSCAVHAAEKARVKEGERVAIFGAGILGILTGLALRSADCDCVFIEPSEERRRIAADLLNVPCLDPQQLNDANSAVRFDAAIDCSGKAQAISQAIRALAKAGRLVVLGLVTDALDYGLPLLDVTMKEVELTGAWLNPNSFEEALRRSRQNTAILEALKTEEFSLADIKAAFQRALFISTSTKKDVHKVLVRP